MKLVRYDAEGGARVGIVEGETVRDGGVDVFAPEVGAPVGGLDALTVIAPVPPPSKIVCVGRNYREHAEETGSAVPTEPQLFAKWANALVGPGAPIVYPGITTQLDYEAELTVVIGRRAQRVAVADALDFVFAYTCGNDVSARDLQFGDGRIMALEQHRRQPVDARQGARHVRADGALARHGRRDPRPAGARDPLRGQR